VSADRTAPDSSVLIAGFDRLHPFCSEARAALAGVRDAGVLVAHTVAETFAVLTGGRYSADPEGVLDYLRQFDAAPIAGIPPHGYETALAELARARVEGGATYDALVALGAREAGATLASLDRRAAETYRRCGVDFRLLLPDSG
jgi:predicted nucleic acid-binding protein